MGHIACLCMSNNNIRIRLVTISFTIFLWTIVRFGKCLEDFITDRRRFTRSDCSLITELKYLSSFN